MEGIIRPKPRFSCPPRVLVCATEVDLRAFSRGLGFPSCGPTLFLSRVFQHQGAALAGPVLGGPQMALLLENLITAGAREIIFWGWAGALREDVPLGALLLPEEALSAEGTSTHYGSFCSPHQGFLAQVARLLVQEGLNFRSGKVVSTDAPYRESVEFCARYAPQALAVEMECAAAFSVARYRKARLAALLFISDRVYPFPETTPKRDLQRLRAKLLPFFRRWLWKD